MTVKTENPVELLMAVADANGVACSTVTDGHVLVFKRDKLRQILATNDHEHVVIFVQRPATS